MIFLPTSRLIPAICLICTGISAQPSFFTQLKTSSPEAISILCDWDSVLVTRDDAASDAKVLVTWKDSVSEWNAEITPRGKFRRTRCGFPPLEINLKKGALRKRGFMEFDKLKLVTHCNPESPRPEDLYEELLVYRLYNVITPASYDVIPLQVHYLYRDGKVFQKNALALLIEPTSELAHRLEGRELEGFGVPPDSLDAQGYCRAALFQFMVGNTDWSQTLQRNIKMIGKPGKYHVVPYDFDFSALVMPGYASISRDYPLNDFRDRIYLGEHFAGQIPETVAEFLSKKDQIMDTVANFPYLPKMRKKEITIYLSEWFSLLENQGRSIKYGTILPYRAED